MEIYISFSGCAVVSTMLSYSSNKEVLSEVGSSPVGGTGEHTRVTTSHSELATKFKKKNAEMRYET